MKTGWLHVVWGDDPSHADRESVIKYFLVDDNSGWTELKTDQTDVRNKLISLNRQRVSVTVNSNTSPDGILTVTDLKSEVTTDQRAARPNGVAAVVGSKPWVTILCRFADDIADTPQQPSYFSGLMSSTAPGLDHYWREVSYGSVNLNGSTVVGWYNLPHPRSYYVYGDPIHFDFNRAVEDATTVADADVYFPNFYGINFIFNEALDGFSWGGSTVISKDGLINQLFGATYIPPSAYGQSAFAHEMGHGFGLPHSSGPYGVTYDSQWDVMSAGGTCTNRDATYGCVGVNTISFHKDKLGWIPLSRRYEVQPGSSGTVNIERLGQPGSNGNFLMAKVPIGSSGNRFYTVETRLFAGYDNQVPGEAIVIHDVDTSRGDRAAQVVDVDNNGNPNDAGAMWLPGETFTDSAHQIQITVNSRTANSFNVTISNPCEYSLSAYGQSFTAAGGTGAVTVNSAGNCAWTASGSSSWVTVNSAGGAGNGTVTFSVLANTANIARYATLSIAGYTFMVTQVAPPTAPPLLLTDEISGRAAAIDSVTSVRDAFPVFNSSNFSADQRTRIILLAVNADLLPGEDIGVVTAQSQSAFGNIPLTIESVRKVPGLDWLTEIVVKLPDTLQHAGDVQMSIALRGVPSNRVIVRIQ